LGPHDFSILAHWIGDVPNTVSALSRSCVIPTTPDVAFVNLEYSSGLIAHVELSWLAPGKLRRTTVVGSRKMIVYDDTSIEPVRLFDAGVDLPAPGSFGEYRLTYRTGEIISPRVEVAEPLALELSDFCTAVRTGSTPRSSVRVGLDVLRVVEAAQESLAQEGARVSVPSPVA
jgi:predicted dehydrogenase